MKTIGIIPCRYQSSRLPGKPLAIIDKKPMMWHVYQRAIESGVLDEVYIATDDQRIQEVAERLDLNCVMTNKDHSTGTDRVAEAAHMLNGDYYVNIQGDEPLIDPEAIKAVTLGIVACKDESVVASNAYSPLTNTADILSSNVVKVTMDVNSNAVSYSRLPIPYPQSGVSSYYRQLGLYGFTKEGLHIFSNSISGQIEDSEQVEMYRFIEHGLKILMVETSDDSISVDTEHDLKRVKAIFGE